jgi:hypothetical protein
MSKCEISIEFDRADRLYRGGETVSGRVRIGVNQDLSCKGIKLIHFWKTHGRGNSDTGPRQELQLAPNRPLLRGETLTFPFSFVAECEPVTYRGNYLNVDHYARVEVDLPWAFDPKREEEFVVRPGKPPDRNRGGLDAAQQGKGNSHGAAIAIVVGLLLLTAAAFLMFVLAPILLAVGLVYWIVRKMIQSRLGEVELIAPKLVVAPGEAWPVEIRFTPRKTFSVNAITLKLVAQESATSGSGTDKKTHCHTLVEQTHTLHPADTLMRGKPFYRQTAVAIPESDAFSFESNNNRVEWWAEVRIDMPGFPDWSQKQTLKIEPREFLQAVSFSREAGAKRQ